MRKASMLTGIAVLAALCAGACHAEEPRPLVLIPGIIGSVLAKPTGEVVWGDWRSLGHVTDLTIADGPKDPADQVRAVAVVQDVAVLGPIKVREYSTLRAFLGTLGYKMGTNYTEFPYDWRQSNYTTAKQFAAFVDADPVLKGKDFDIIAHSMGGLVAEIYAKGLDDHRRVRRIVNMAVPFMGSAATLDTLQHGWGDPANWAAGGLTAIRRLLLSMPSFYELLPRYRFCCILGRPGDADRTPYSPLSAQTWQLIDWDIGARATTTDGQVGEALRHAEQLRDLAATPYPSYVQAFSLVGSNIDTPWQYYVDPAARSITSFNIGTGDGTVPAGSAANDDLAKAFVSMSQHERIFADRSASEAIKRILTGSGDGLPVDYNAKIYAAATRDGATVQVQSVGLDVGPSLVLPNARVDVIVRLTGDAGAPLDAVLVTGSIQDGTGLVTQLSFTASQGASATTAAYAAATTVGHTPGPIGITVTVPGLPTLYDTIVVSDR